MFTLPPPHVLAGVRHPRLALPRTDLEGLRVWLHGTGVSVPISGEALFALAEEPYGKERFYFDQRRILAFFDEWNARGRPVSAGDLQGELVDLLYSLVVE